MCNFCEEVSNHNPTTSASLKTKWSIETGKSISYKKWLESRVIESENDIQRTEQANELFQQVLTDEFNKNED